MKKIHTGIIVLMLFMPLFVLSVSAAEKGSASEEAAAKYPEIMTGVVKEIDQAGKTMKVQVLVTTRYSSPKENVRIRESVVENKEVVIDISSAKLKKYKDISAVRKGDHVKIKYGRKGERIIAEIIRRVAGKG